MTSNILPVDSKFPHDLLLPKKETQTVEFLTKYPTCDGRGILVAIMDTGIDPACDGLQVTSEGKPKIVELIDCSGSGDVDTSTVKTAVDGVLVGLTGRKLNIPETWKNPSGKFHLGVKPVFEMYSPSLRTRIKAERKERLWQSQQALALADANRQMHPEDGSPDVKEVKTLEEKWRQENLSAAVDVLKAADKSYDDVGLVADCIVFFDGDMWRACIDTTFSGRLKDCTLMSPFKDTRQYATFSEDDLLTYSVNMHHKGNVLEIVTTSNAHGTHVAGITAACFPEDAARNGLAPGAQLIGLKISDCRLDSMETGTAFARALNRCVELGVSVVNYSFGEATHIANSGCLIEHLRRAVHRHGILFVSSAGNNGPALSTVGAPGATCDASLGIGAYLSSAMATSMYAIREAVPSTLYPWTSRGPSPDGALGVSICAPGGAITCVPKWSLRAQQLMNGTSMSSPSATGAIACLMSALKQNDMTFNNHTIRMALENTAHIAKDDDPFAVGYGMLQLCNSFDYLTKHSAFLAPFDAHITHFALSIKVDDGGPNTMRGVYLRNAKQTDRPRQIVINVEPKWMHDTPAATKASFSRSLVLTCDAPYVTHPKHIQMMNMTTTFSIALDVAQVKEGEATLTHVNAFDTANVELGPIWRVPITIIRPTSGGLTADGRAVEEERTMRPSKAVRHFVDVPVGGEYAVLEMHNLSADRNLRMIVHAVQILPDQSYKHNESHKMVTIPENGHLRHVFRVHSSRTLELALCKWWASLGDIRLRYTLRIFGGAPVERGISLQHHSLCNVLHLENNLGSVDVLPQISMKHLCAPLRPLSSTIRPLGVRDLQADGEQTYVLVMEYEFSVKKACDVTVHMAGISDYLYENSVESQMCLIHSKAKQFMGASDAFPDRWATKLPKGDYTATMHIRSCDESLLNKLKDSTAVATYKLATPINLEFYSNVNATIRPETTGKLNGSPSTMSPGSRRPFYVAPMADDKVPKHATPGCYLTGAMSLSKDVDVKKCCQYPVVYTIGTIVTAKAKTTEPTFKPEAETKTKSQLMQLQEARRDLDITHLSKMSLVADLNALYAKLSIDHADHVPLYTAYLRALVEKSTIRHAVAIVAACDKILALVDESDVLRRVGVKQELGDEAQNKTELDTERDAYIEALICKLSIYADAVLNSSSDSPQLFHDGAPLRIDGEKGFTKRAKRNLKLGSSTPGSPTGSVSSLSSGGVGSEIEDIGGDQSSLNVKLGDVDELFVRLVRFVDAGDKRATMAFVKHAVCQEQYARALKMLAGDDANCMSKTTTQLAIQLYEKLGWMHVARMAKNALLVRNPPARRLF